MDPTWSGGRPAKTDQATRDRICQIPRCCPRDLGWPFSTRSLSKLAEVLRTNTIADISRETVRQILNTGGVSWQATKTRKAGNDPDFQATMTRVLDLYGNPPADGRVICVDEFGPLDLQPRGGRGWFTARRPRRLRAIYHRTQGVRHTFGALDLRTGQLCYRIRDRKRWTEFLAFLKSVRDRWPDQKLYLICDNYSVHKRAEVRAWCSVNAIELVFLPTYSSWLNRVECEFAALRYFALNGTDHRSPGEQDDAIATYVRWRNQHAEPIRDFAVGSKIRRPNYLTNIA
ncbi:IS630 family transposase [Nocardia nova]|uniref:IS630 family transposase n=1 Tax=Nocardia nova TaxID=37330 RepID=A0A2S6AJU1_9NOCA|nr:IS630 family transposase [Nocardia nova]PPJ35491.1 IS630 family transposase [Nocardia nova]